MPISVSWLVKCQANEQMKGLAPGSVTLDFGAGRGDLVSYLIRNSFSAFGIEKDQGSINFARSVYGIDLWNEINQLDCPLDSISMWHSLEHLTYMDAVSVFKELDRISAPGTRLIISVPNSKSWFYRYFNKKYAFLDISAHPVNHSLNSISNLLVKSGYAKPTVFFMLPYSFIGYLLSLMNLFQKRRNYLHERFKRGSFEANITLDALSLMLAVLLAPLALLLCILDILHPQNGIVLNCKSLKTS